ncbi:MAG: phosphate signaling complex protein PhoU [Proteobacteria bacterium]|nr:phosphate signaling complex protein PhoU [Pseudomonadota bacterium]
MEQRAHFTEKLEELKMLVLRMAAMCERAVRNSLKAYFETDAVLAEEIIEADNDINELEDQIDKLVLEMLALGQPMAGDLRTVLGSGRIIINLERLGDEAVNMAHRALFLSTRPPLPHNEHMEQLADTVTRMLSMALKAFVDRDVKLAEQVCNMDNLADELYIKLLKEYISGMVTETRVVERGVHAILAIRHLERIGDLSTNVSESVIFIVQGESVKHRCKA